MPVRSTATRFCTSRPLMSGRTTSSTRQLGARPGPWPGQELFSRCERLRLASPPPGIDQFQRFPYRGVVIVHDEDKWARVRRHSTGPWNTVPSIVAMRRSCPLSPCLLSLAERLQHSESRPAGTSRRMGNRGSFLRSAVQNRSLRTGYGSGEVVRRVRTCGNSKLCAWIQWSRRFTTDTKTTMVTTSLG